MWCGMNSGKKKDQIVCVWINLLFLHMCEDQMWDILWCLLSFFFSLFLFPFFPLLLFFFFSSPSLLLLFSFSFEKNKQKFAWMFWCECEWKRDRKRKSKKESLSLSLFGENEPIYRLCFIPYKILKSNCYDIQEAKTGKTFCVWRQTSIDVLFFFFFFFLFSCWSRVASSFRFFLCFLMNLFSLFFFWSFERVIEKNFKDNFVENGEAEQCCPNAHFFPKNC